MIGQKNTNYDDVIDQIENVDHVTPKATYPELVVALQNGDAVGITAEMPVAEGVVASNPDLTIVKFEDGKGFDVDTTVSIGLKNNTKGTESFDSVQDALDKISKDTRNDYMKKRLKLRQQENKLDASRFCLLLEDVPRKLANVLVRDQDHSLVCDRWYDRRLDHWFDRRSDPRPS